MQDKQATQNGLQQSTDKTAEQQNMTQNRKQ